MNTSFKVKRGHVWHIIHETKTGSARDSAWTLCGQYYAVGERGSHTPTCPGCLKIDNPLMLPAYVHYYLRLHAEAVVDPDTAGVYSRGLEALVKADYVTHENAITRRGRVILEDFRQHPVPMPDKMYVFHARHPLGLFPKCDVRERLPDGDTMTTSHYAKLRLIESQVVVTCFQCIARG